MFSKQDKPRFFFYRSIERIEITYATMVISIHEITHILYVFLISLIHTTSTPLLQFALLNMVLYAVWKFNTQRSGWILARQKKNINTKCHLRIAIVMIWSAYFSRLDTLRSNYMSVTSTAYWWWAAMKLINILKAMVMRWSITSLQLCIVYLSIRSNELLRLRLEKQANHFKNDWCQRRDFMKAHRTCARQVASQIVESYFTVGKMLCNVVYCSELLLLLFFLDIQRGKMHVPWDQARARLSYRYKNKQISKQYS